MRQKLRYLLENWKMLIHLMFRTYHFGMIKGVACVQFGEPVGHKDYFARQHAMMKLKEEMADILRG